MLIAMTFASNEAVSMIAGAVFAASLAFVLATIVLFPAITWFRAMLRLGERSANGAMASNASIAANTSNAANDLNAASHIAGHSIRKVSGDIDDTTGNATDRESRFPRLSVVVACYNEARFIGSRIENLLACDYPRELLEIVVASDGSTDATEAIASRFADRGVRVVRTERGGKGQALNAGVAAATGEVLVFTDANTEFRRDALQAIVRPLADPAIGGVAGNQRYVRGGEASLTADGECLHWNWDTRQKLWQSLGGSVTAATGALYAVRRSCFDPVPPHVMDDFHISTGVVARGLRLVFAADAVAVEPVATRDGVEFQRKVRVAVQGLRAVWMRRGLLNPFRHGWYAAQLFAHKVARRLLPVPLIAMAISAAMLAGESRLHAAVLAAGGGVVGLALVSAATRFAPNWHWPRAKLFAIPHFFCMAQAALLLAWWRVLRGDGLRVWEPERHSAGSGRETGTWEACAR